MSLPTAGELAKRVGWEVEVKAGPGADCWVTFVVVDVRVSYGVVQYEVQPLAGRGRVWMSADRCYRTKVLGG